MNKKGMGIIMSVVFIVIMFIGGVIVGGLLFHNSPEETIIQNQTCENITVQERCNLDEVITLGSEINTQWVSLLDNMTKQSYENGRKSVHCGGGGNSYTPQPLPLITYEDSDLNQDGQTDITDLTIYAELYGKLQDNFGRTNCNESNEWCDGTDLNENGEVDTTDLTILAERYPDGQD